MTSVLTPPLSAVESLCQTTWPVLPGRSTAATIAKTATPSIAAVTAVISAASAAPVTVATIVTVAAAAVGTNAVALAAADATAQEPAWTDPSKRAQAPSPGPGIPASYV